MYRSSDRSEVRLFLGSKVPRKRDPRQGAMRWIGGRGVSGWTRVWCVNGWLGGKPMGLHGAAAATPSSKTGKAICVQNMICVRLQQARRAYVVELQRGQRRKKKKKSEAKERKEEEEGVRRKRQRQTGYHAYLALRLSVPLALAVCIGALDSHDKIGII